MCRRWAYAWARSYSRSPAAEGSRSVPPLAASAGSWMSGGGRRPPPTWRRVSPGRRAKAWGVQFHPEVSLPTFRAWAEELPEVDTDAVTAELAARDAEVASAGRSLALRFAQVVAGRRR